jgi:oligopeptide transport system substrate-binding protein
MKRFIFVFAILLTVIGVFFIRQVDFQWKEKNNQLNLVISTPLQTFDPAIVFNDDGLNVISQAHETLYEYHYLKRPYEVIPLLADGMPKISNDGKSYIIKIKPNILYHQHPSLSKNRTVKAEDFIIAIKRLAFKPLNSPGKAFFSGKLLGFEEFSEAIGNDFNKILSEKLEGLEALDDLTLKIQLKLAEPNLIFFLAMNFVSPIPVELFVSEKNDFNKVLIGTGPYYLKKFNDESYQFERNSEFREQLYPSTGDRYAHTSQLLNSSTEKLPFVDRLNFYVIKDELVVWEKFKKLEVDIINVPSVMLAKVQEQDENFLNQLKQMNAEVKHFSKTASRWISFNMNDPVLGKNLNLRKAIAHAIDLEAYIKVVSNNTNLPANSIYNPEIAGYRPNHKNSFEYNLDKAKEFLKKAGYAEGQGLPEINYYGRGLDEPRMREAEFIKSSLEKIGIKIKINLLPFYEFITKGRAGELQFFTDNWIYDYPDAENMIQLLISKNHPGINKSGFKNKAVDDAYLRLSQIIEKEERFKVYHSVEKIIYDELPWIMLMYESAYIIHRNDIGNFRKSFIIRNYLKYLKKV